METSRMWDKNLLPRPEPSLAPFTNPAISTNSTVAGLIGGLFPNNTSGVALDDSPEVEEPLATISAKASSLSSGTGIIPTFGSIVGIIPVPDAFLRVH